MGVRIVVRDGETVQEAYRRFQKAIKRFGRRQKWHKPRYDVFQKRGELRRRAEFEAKWVHNCAAVRAERARGGPWGSGRPE